MKKAFLFMLSLLAVVGIQAQTSPYAGNEVAEGEFYLYNVGTGLWIQNIDANNRRSDDNWNTGAGMGTAGFDFVLTAVDGGYKLDPKEAPNNMGWGYGDGNVLYLDGNIGGNTHWDFTAVDGVSNGYKITIDDHVLAVEVVNDKAFLVNTDTENNVWQLVTKAERLEKMQTIVSDGKPYDLSFLLGDWNFATNNQRRGQWAEAQVGGNNDGYPRARRWNSSHLVWNTNSYSWTQTVADLPDGLYQFSVQGMYRDGNRDQVGAKAANGETNLIAKYFIGGVEGSLMSILAEASETQGDGFATAIENTNPQLYAPDNADNWTIVWALHPDKYWNEPIKVNVRGGSVELGVRKTSLIGGDWIAMNEFKLEYVGPIDPTASKEALQGAISAAEAYNGKTTEALATALATALSEAQDALESTDIDLIEAKTEALNKARAAAETVDAANLYATVALAEAEGIDVTTAKEVCQTATETAAVNDALNALRIARQVKHADTAENVWTGNEPAAGDFYLYNVGTGRFLCGGDDWGAHAALGFPGIAVTLIEDGGNFKIDTHLNNGGTSEYLNYGGYMDTPDQNGWYFQEVGEGVYNIVRGENHSQLLGYSANTFARIDTDKADAADPNNQWILVSKADRDALMAQASKTNPVDVSYLIQSPGFNQREVISAWTMDSYSIWDRGGNHPDFICESWNTTSNKLSQTIENLTPGLYQVSVQGYFRDGDHGNQVAVATDRAQLATFYANGESMLLPNILAEVDKAPGLGSNTTVGEFPYDANQAANYFRNGLYKNTLTVFVDEDGKLEIGVYKDEKNFDRDWVVVDNFRLTYLGYDEAAALQARYESALASIEDGSAYSIKTDVSGTPYYLKTDGSLTDDATAAGIFKFSKVKGGAYEYGFNLLDAYFTNPPVGGNPTLANGHIATDTNSKRNDWEAQVFFKNAEGKYAVRATNAAGGTSGWPLNASTFWTVNDGPVAEYSFDTNYIWELEYQYGADGVAAHEAAAATIASWIPAVQAGGGLVQDASQYTSNAVQQGEGSIAALLDDTYETYFHSCWSNGPAEDHYLQAELTEPVQKFQFYFKKRHNNNNNRPTTIVISASTDGSTFTDVTTINSGMPTDASVLDYLSDVIDLGGEYKYVRFTVTATNNGATNNNHVFFTFSEFYILPSIPAVESALAMVKEGTPTYSLDVAAVEAADAALKDALNVVKVTYVLKGEDGSTIEEKVVLQERGSDVNVPSTMTNIGYCDYAIEGTIGQEDCTITITRSLKAGLVTALTDLSNDKAYTITCDRGAMLTKDGYMASTAHSSLTAAEASNFAIINYEDNYYLYSVVDSKFVTNTGALADEPTNGVEDAIKMTPNTMPYFMYYFVKDGANNGLNTNGNDPYGYVINTWMNADPGNLYYMIEAADFDATAAVAALDNFFHPVVALNAPTWSAAEGTQAEPTWLPIGETLKINFTAENLEANGLAEDDVKVKMTVLVSGDLPENIMNMQSTTAHRVLGESFEIPLGETDFPVALKEGYVYQNIVIVSAQLVKGEEVIATYAGDLAIQLHWVGLTAPIKGDTNNDGSVDVADHGVIRDNILENADYDAKLDINEDQYVDCADLTAVVNIILYGDWQGEPDPASGVRGQASADVLTLNYVSNGRYALMLQSGRSYNSFQMDLDVPAGMTLVSEDAGSHTVMTSRLENGKTRVLVFSLNNAAFEGNEILYLNVAGEGTLSAENIIFADANANAVRMTLGNATGINGVDQNETNTIYDLSGRKADTMRRGVNIIRKVDGTTKKVLK